MNSNDKIMCPSSRAQTGARLLGIRQPDGSVAILPQVLQIDEQFIKDASKELKAEQRFRFTNKCVESGCKQWTGSRCGVADAVVSLIDELVTSKDLPQCYIRPQCRWFKQNGSDACKACQFVITETTAEEWEEKFKTAGKKHFISKP